MIDLWIAPELQFWHNFGTRTWYERSFGPFSGVNLWDEETEKEEQHLSCRQGSQTRFPTGTIKEITQHLSVTRHETPVFPAISVIYSEQFQSSSLWVDFPVGWFFGGPWWSLMHIHHTCLYIVSGWWFGTFLFPYILGISSSQLTKSYFSEGWLNHQPVLHERGVPTSRTNQQNLERCLRTWRCGDGGGWADLEGYHEILTVKRNPFFFEVIC